MTATTLFTSIDTTAVTERDLSMVEAITQDGTIFFQVETGDFDLSNDPIAHNVSFENGIFVCTCNGDTCGHIILAVALIKDRKIEDYFLVATPEIFGREPVAGSSDLQFSVKDGEIFYSVILDTQKPQDSYCTCGTFHSQPWCQHKQAAQAFEVNHQRELADYHASC